ncbi:DUF222 domain-containing protein [Microbacterium deminutum]|uniref:DUF222 domain-containing protein n=1 Tax=Microbacterium deminutum TaxID=344164 RepID=A0ABP5CCH0_9MICO
MDNLEVADLARLAGQVGEVVGRFARVGLESLADADAVLLLTLAGRLLRNTEALLIEGVGRVASRSETGDREARLTSRFGCHDVIELVQRTTLLSAQSASRLQRAARAVDRETSTITGGKLPARLPSIREALLDGVVGVDGVLAVAGALADLERRVERDAVLAADQALAATARGDGPDAAPAASADILRLHATAWASALDPDGSEPREREALHARTISLGRPRSGVVPIHGALLPEVAAQFQRICDALSHPRGDDDTGGVRFHPEADGAADGSDFVPPDERRPAQRRHDALATALFAAAASGTLPTIGGSAPTLVVAVRESDLLDGRGLAHSDSCIEPMPIGAAHRVACAGAMQRIVISEDGRIVQIGT